MLLTCWKRAVKAEFVQMSNSSFNEMLLFFRSKYEQPLQSGHVAQNTLANILCICGARNLPPGK